MSAKNEVYEVVFEYFEIDPQSQKSSMRLVGHRTGDDIPEDEKNFNVEIAKGVILDFESRAGAGEITADDVRVEVVGGAKFQTGMNYYSYTRETAFLVHQKVFDAVRSFFDRHPEVDEVGAIIGSRYSLIGPAAKEIRMDTELPGEEQGARSKQEVMDGLKAYETPTNIHEITISLVQKNMLRGFYRAYQTHIHTILARKKEIESLAELHNDSMKMAARTDQLQAAMKLLRETGFERVEAKDMVGMFKNNASYESYFKFEERKEVLRLADAIIEHIPEAETALKAERARFPFAEIVKNDFGAKYFENLQIPIMDMQAGSGREFFKVFDASGFPGLLTGTELRTEKEVGQDGENRDERYLVYNGINFLQYKGAYRSVYQKNNLTTATSAQINFLNPPYSNEDLVAKESIATLKKDAILFGLFPTKMESYLRQHIDGVIFNIPKKLSGYTEENVPSRLLYVAGKRFVPTESDEEGLMRFSTPKCKVYRIDTEKIGEAIVKMRGIMNTEKGLFDSEYYLTKSLEYYQSEPLRATTLHRHLGEAIEATSRFLQNQALLAEALEKNRSDILSKMSPMELLKTEKVYLDMRFYKPDGDYERYTFKDIISDIPLLVFYRENYPRLFNLIWNVAEEMNVEMPIGRSDSKPFDLSDPVLPEKKDRITNTHLGMLKLYYYPSMIDLSKPDNKALMADIVLSIASRREDLPADKIEAARMKLMEIFSHATKIVTKNEVVMIEETSEVAKQEVFVLIDAYEKDIGRLDISLTDFYTELERRGIFRIDDYVEIAALSNEDKTRFVENFYQYLLSVLKRIDPDLDPEAVEKSRVFSTILDARKKVVMASKALGQKNITQKEAQRRIFSAYKEFQAAHNLDEFFDEQLQMPEPQSYVLKEVNRIETLVAFYGEDKQGKEQRAKLGTEIGALVKKDVFSFFNDPLRSREALAAILDKHGVPQSYHAEVIGEIYDRTSMLFTIKSSTLNASAKFAKTMVINFFDLHARYRQKKEDPVKVYDSTIPVFFTKRLGLKEHQFNEAERFAAMRDDMKLELLLWEMRSGKSRAFLATSFFLSLLDGKDSHVFLEAKNVQDIVTQALESMPFVFFGMNIFLNSSSNLKFSEASTRKWLPAPMFPNIPKLAKSMFAQIGRDSEAEAQRFTQNFEQTLAIVRERMEKEELGIDELKEAHADSAFLGCLDLCGA